MAFLPGRLVLMDDFESLGQMSRKVDKLRMYDCLLL